MQDQYSPKHEEMIPEIEEENFENLDLPESHRREKNEIKESRIKEILEPKLTQEALPILEKSVQAKSNLATVGASGKSS